MRSNPRRAAKAIGALVALTLVAAACDSGGGGTTDAGGGPDGDVVVTGSSTVEPISARNAEKFNEESPGVAISVNGPGTGDGFEAFCNGQAGITDASRPVKADEVELCKQNGIEFVELLVARDALSVVTSPENDDLECLSFLDLYALLGPESEGFTTWSDADDLAGELVDADLDEAGDPHAPYPDEDLVVTAPGEESGTYDTFVELAIAPIAGARGQEEATRADYQASPNDNVIIEGTTGSPTSLGWVGFAFVRANPDAVKALAVDNGGGCVTPSPETVNDGTYPLARPLFIYVNKATADENEAVASFVDFYLSDAGLASVSEVGYVDLTAEEIAATRAAWESRTTGSQHA